MIAISDLYCSIHGLINQSVRQAGRLVVGLSDGELVSQSLCPTINLFGHQEYDAEMQTIQCYFSWYS